MFWIIFNKFYNEIITFVNTINQNGNLLFLSTYIHFFFKGYLYSSINKYLELNITNLKYSIETKGIKIKYILG